MPDLSKHGKIASNASDIPAIPRLRSPRRSETVWPERSKRTNYLYSIHRVQQYWVGSSSVEALHLVAGKARGSVSTALTISYPSPRTRGK